MPLLPPDPPPLPRSLPTFTSFSCTKERRGGRGEEKRHNVSFTLSKAPPPSVSSRVHCVARCTNVRIVRRAGWLFFLSGGGETGIGALLAHA